MKNLKLKQFVRRCLLMAVTTVFALTVNAIPAKPGLVKVITLENGKTVDTTGSEKMEKAIRATKMALCSRQ